MCVNQEMDRLANMKKKHASNVLQPVASDDKYIKTQHKYCHVVVRTS